MDVFNLTWMAKAMTNMQRTSHDTASTDGPLGYFNALIQMEQNEDNCHFIHHWSWTICSTSMCSRSTFYLETIVESWIMPQPSLEWGFWAKCLIIDYIYKVHYKLSSDHHPVYSDDVAIGEAFGEASCAFQSCVYGSLHHQSQVLLKLFSILLIFLRHYLRNMGVPCLFRYL